MKICPEKVARPTSEVRTAYHGSDRALTRRVLRQLEARGEAGSLAALLFRAQKASTRAKRYRGGIGRGWGGVSYRDLAYERKEECLERLCLALQRNDGMGWGWAEDDQQPVAPWVLYVDLPGIGQVSFHAPERGSGPDYPGTWDRSHASEERILAYCDAMMTSEAQHDAA